MDDKKIEKISIYILSITGIVVVIDTLLANQFNAGTYQNNLVIFFCIGFVLLSTKFPNISKNKYVIFPLYIMIIQTVYSLVSKYF